jgi:hypothetical protein
MSNPKILSLSAALSAFAGPAAIATHADANVDTVTQPATARHLNPTFNLAVGKDLMAFTVGENADGIVVASHSSHSSHASHTSHHSSSSPGHASHASHSSHYSSR